jgi:hypothetical protein
MANAVQDAKSRASLLQMAQVWLRLAQAHDAEKHSDRTPGEEMQPRIQPTNAVLRPRFRQRPSEVP